MKTYTRAMNGTGTDDWLLTGGSAFVLMSTGVVTITVYGGGGKVAEFDDVTGILGWTYKTRDGLVARYDYLVVHSTIAQTVEIACGDTSGEMQYNPPGIIESIANPVSIIKSAANAFIAAYSYPASAGLANMFALYNSAASGGKSLYVERFAFSSAVAGALVQIGQINAPLSGNAESIFVKTLGAAAGVGQLQILQSASVPSGIVNQTNITSAQASAYVEAIKGSRVVVPPGYGMLLMTVNVDQQLDVLTEWYEQ